MRARFALSVGLLVGVLAWALVSTRPQQKLSSGFHWQSGTQIQPLCVLPQQPFIGPPEGSAAEAWLDARSIHWAEPRPAQTHALFIRGSKLHWLRLELSLSELERYLKFPASIAALEPGESRQFAWSRTAILNDLDGDGDPLDAGELGQAGNGVEAIVMRRSAALEAN